MALLKKKKEKEKKPEAPKTEVSSSVLNDRGSFIIIRPRVTEKASLSVAENNSYVFEIVSGATKYDVSRAIKDLYKVSPAKIRIAKSPSKRIWSKGKWGRTPAIKKAYVYLNKGDKIEIV